MSFATTTVEVAFASAPLGGSYTWTDITDYVKSIDTSRGRDYELDQVQAGKATIVLSNTDGRFTPGLASSPYYPNVMPRRRVRIRTTDPLASGSPVVTQPTIDVVATTTVSSGTSATWNHTVSSGSNRLLVVDIGFTANSDEVGTMTYGGVAMTLAGSVQSGTGGTDRRFERWYLVNPTVGTAAIVATLYNSATHLNSGVTLTTIAAASTSLFNVDQTTPVGTSVVANGTAATTGSLAPTTLTNDLVMTGLMARTTTAETSTGTTTSANLLAGSNNYLGYGTGNGATSWSWPVSDRFAAVATPVHGATTGGGAATPTAVFTGLVESWQQSFPGGGAEASEIVLSAVDGFKALGQADLLEPYAQTVLTDGAVAYYPLGESDTATAAVDQKGTYAPALPVSFGSAQASLGSGSIVTGGKASALLTGTDFSYAAPALSLAQPNANGVSLGLTGSFEFWFQASGTLGGNAYILAATPATDPQVGGVAHQDGIYLQARPNFLALQVGPSYLSSTAIPAFTLYDGHPHHVVVAWSAAGVTVYYDGASAYSDSTAASFPAPLTWITLGATGASRRNGFGLGQASATLNGNIQAVAVYNTKLSATQALTHYRVGISGWQGEGEAARAGRVLDLAGWPAADRSLDGSLSTLSPATWSEGSNALALLQQYVADAGGYVFVNGSGQVVYHNRQHRLNQASKVTFTEATGMGIEGDVQFHMDDSNILNTVSVTTPNNEAQVAADATSIAAYGKVASSLTLNVQSALEALDAANWRIALYRNPLVRCDTLTIEPVTSDALWQWALGLELGDRITIGGLPASAPASSATFIVEAVRHKIVAEGLTPAWSTSLQLSPDVPIQGLTLDDNTYGILDLDCLVY